MELRTDGTILVDEHGRQRILHGVTVRVQGEGAAGEGPSDDDLAHLVEMGLDAVRLEASAGESVVAGAVLDALLRSGLRAVLAAAGEGADASVWGDLARDLGAHSAVIGYALPADAGPEAAAAIRAQRPDALVLHASSSSGEEAAPTDGTVDSAVDGAAPVLLGDPGAADAGSVLPDLLDRCDRRSSSWFLGALDDDFPGSEAARHLRRPRAMAIAGRALRAEASSGGGWKAAWSGAEGSVPTVFWVPAERDVELMVDGARTSILREGGEVLIAPRGGEHRLRVL